MYMTSTLLTTRSANELSSLNSYLSDRVSYWCEEMIVKWRQVGEYGGRFGIPQSIDFKVSFTGIDVGEIDVGILEIRHNSMQKWYIFLSLKQYFTSDFAIFIGRSFK